MMIRRAAYVGLVVGVGYAVLFELGVPLCAPSTASCALDRLGVVLAVPIGLVAAGLSAMWTLSTRRQPGGDLRRR